MLWIYDEIWNLDFLEMSRVPSFFSLPPILFGIWKADWIGAPNRFFFTSFFSIVAKRWRCRHFWSEMLSVPSFGRYWKKWFIMLSRMYHKNEYSMQYFIALKYHFQLPTKKWFLWCKLLKKICVRPILQASFDTFKADIGQLFTPQSTFECPCEW